MLCPLKFFRSTTAFVIIASLHIYVSIHPCLIKKTSAYLYELKITLPSLISNTGQVGVPLLTVFAYNTAVIEGVLT